MFPWRGLGNASKQSEGKNAGSSASWGTPEPGVYFGDMNGFRGKRGHTVCYETAGPSQQRSEYGASRKCSLLPKKPQQQWTGNSGHFLRDPFPWWAWWKLSQNTVSAAEGRNTWRAYADVRNQSVQFIFSRTSSESQRSSKHSALLSPGWNRPLPCE